MTDNKDKPVRRAVALRYQEFEPAPKVIAKGQGELAERIIEAAKKHQIFVHDSPELVDVLAQLDIDDMVPQMLWEVVAELLVWAKGVDANT